MILCCVCHYIFICVFYNLVFSLFFFKQKTAYEMRISDRSSDVCSSDLEGIAFGATMLLGGRVGGEALRLYMIYDAGNAIECQPDTPYLQIGEFKYGKPILDRSLDYGTPLNEAVKIGLISFDSTMRSNLAVGLPIDMVTLRNGEGQEAQPFRIERGDPYFTELSRSWGEKLREAQSLIPRPPFIKPRE